MHYASLTCNSTRPQHIHVQSVLITGFKSLPGLPGVKGLIAAYIWRNPSSSNSHPHRICNFRTLSSGSDSNADNQYSQYTAKWRFIVRDLTDWANENHTLGWIRLNAGLGGITEYGITILTCNILRKTQIVKLLILSCHFIFTILHNHINMTQCDANNFYRIFFPTSGLQKKKKYWFHTNMILRTFLTTVINSSGVSHSDGSCVLGRIHSDVSSNIPKKVYHIVTNNFVNLLHISYTWLYKTECWGRKFHAFSFNSHRNCKIFMTYFNFIFDTICLPYIFRKSIFGWNCDHDTPLCDTPLLEDTPLCDTPDKF